MHIALRTLLAGVASCLILGLASRAEAGSTLHDAIAQGDVNKVVALLAEGADIEAPTSTGETPLMAASLADQPEIANLLIQAGANVYHRNDRGMTSLHAAAYIGSARVLWRLLEAGADLDDKSNRFGVTPLIAAAEENRPKAVQLLLSRGADVSATELNGYTALTRAGWREYWTIAAMLVEAGAKCQPEELVGDWLYSRCTQRFETEKPE